MHPCLVVDRNYYTWDYDLETKKFIRVTEYWLTTPKTYEELNEEYGPLRAAKEYNCPDDNRPG